MNIAELHKAIRERVGEHVSSSVSLRVWHFAHQSDNPEVTANISVLWEDRCEQIEAPTAEAALKEFDSRVAVTLVAPAEQRLADMDVEPVELEAL